MPAIDPSFVTTGGAWKIDGATPQTGGAAPEGGDGFAGALGRQLENLGRLQSDAAEQSRALATGQATDVSQVVTSVERARLAMQLASTLRTKSVEAIQDLMRTTV